MYLSGKVNPQKTKKIISDNNHGIKDESEDNFLQIQSNYAGFRIFSSV
jgi:hypothetical protein